MKTVSAAAVTIGILVGTTWARAQARFGGAEATTSVNDEGASPASNDDGLCILGSVSRLERRHVAHVRAIAEELDTLRCDGQSVLDTVLPQVRELLDVETMATYRVREKMGGWALDMFQASGAYTTAALRTPFQAFLANTPAPFGVYDPTRPDPAQRNRVVDGRRILLSRDAELPLIFPKFFEPLGLADHWQPRVLVCEGPSLLGWFGAFHPQELSPLQLRLLSDDDRRIVTGGQSGAVHLWTRAGRSTKTGAVHATVAPGGDELVADTARGVQMRFRIETPGSASASAPATRN